MTPVVTAAIAEAIVITYRDVKNGSNASFIIMVVFFVPRLF